ncbi:hypothetical protein Tco_1140709 [Tanacetum coccineum]
MFESQTKKPEESSSNWKPWHKDWDAITSKHSEDDAIKDDGKYHYNRKGFLEDDESSDDSILIVDPGWDDYCLQELNLNRLVPLCPEARRPAFGLTASVESSDNEKSLGEDASKQEKIDAIDVDEEITLVFVAKQEVAANKKNDEVNVVEEVVQVSAADNVVSTAGTTTTVSAATITTDDDREITLAQALIEMKSTKPKVKGVVIQEPSESATTKSSQLSSQQSQDKGKGILIELVEPMKKKDLIRLDEETALKLQAEIDEEERLAREKAEKEKEANIALIKT